MLVVEIALVQQPRFCHERTTLLLLLHELKTLQLSLFVLLNFLFRKSPVSKELEALLYLSLPFSIFCLTFSAHALMLIIHSVTYFREKTLNYDCISYIQITRLCHIMCFACCCSFFTILLWFASVVAPFESVESDH